MAYGPELNRLATLWSAQPTSTYFAPLAEALRKRGALEQATAVAAAGVAVRPDYLPGRLVMARIYRDQGEWQAARAEIQAALLLDANNPVALEALAELGDRATGNVPAVAVVVAQATPAETDHPETTESSEAAELVFSDEIDAADDPGPASEPVLTESLAMLYRGQGHLEEAVVVLDALVARAPANQELLARRDAVRAELAESRPRPYDATRSGGKQVRDWLSGLATSRVVPAQAASGFDAFYQAPATAPTEAGDLEAFQSWLRELDR